MCRNYLGKIVLIEIDQAYGTYYKNTQYEVNYGFVSDTIAPDGEPLDAYYLGPKEPLKKATGKCVAIIHRLEDDDDKLIIVPENEEWSDEQIESAVKFREKLFKHEIIR